MWCVERGDNGPCRVPWSRAVVGRHQDAELVVLDVEEIRQDGAVVGVIRKVKMSERHKRTELIGKHVRVQAFNEKVEFTGAGGGPVQIETIRRVIVDPRNRDA